MKKVLIIISCAFIIFCLVFALILDGGENSIPSRLSWYHNKEIINLAVDGQKVVLDNIDIVLSSDGCEAKGKIRNGKFKFKQGDYGNNVCIFIIPAELYSGQIDIIVKADYWSYCSWDVNDFNINISIATTSGVSVYADGFVKTKSEKAAGYFKAVAKEISDGNNMIEIFALGSP